MRYHLTPGRTAVIKKIIITTVGEDAEKREACAIVVKCKFVELLQQTVLRFLKNLKQNYNIIQQFCS